MAELTELADLEEIIEREVLYFEDVSRFDEATLTEKMLSGGKAAGIRITEDDDDKLVITMDIIVYYGVNIPQLCYDIQTHVKKAVEKECGMTVKAVNIRIEGIDKRP
jgi:uncharacterized alkaline shock family protein YloU